MPFHLRPDSTDRPAPPASRRRFLAGVAAGAALGGCSRAWGRVEQDDKAEGSPGPGGWYGLISDVHIAADPSRKLFGQDLSGHLRAVIADVLATAEPPRGIFITGDLALADGQPGDYAQLLTLLEPLRVAGIPVHMILGNHDNRDNFRVAMPGTASESTLPEKQVSVVEGDGIRFLLLDSNELTHATRGSLGPAQMGWLAQDLDAHAETPTMVLVHHHPQHVPWSQVEGLADSAEFMDVLRPRAQVKAVVFGHTHGWNLRQEGGLFLVNLPAVAYSFDPSQPLGWCRFRPEPGGASWEMRCVAGNRRTHKRRHKLAWCGA